MVSLGSQFTAASPVLLPAEQVRDDPWGMWVLNLSAVKLQVRQDLGLVLGLGTVESSSRAGLGLKGGIRSLPSAR